KTPALIIGYSFGAWVAARLMKRSRTPCPCIYVSPPTGMFAFPSMKGDTAWAVTGSDDQFCSIPLLEGLMDRDRITVVSGVDHFWFGDEGALEEYLRGRLDVAAAAAVG
ncbi:MAG TPA: hypothetical protein PLR71_06685, partial [Deltaproteobacteria bacterium]|nr:hypothetical protein [Deltaproteobacteria bacterium]